MTILIRECHVQKQSRLKKEKKTALKFEDSVVVA